MKDQITENELAAIDRFIAEPKILVSTLPDWKASSRPPDKEASWDIEDSIGIIKSHLRFRFTYIDSPSISLIYRNWPIWRIDFALNSKCKPSPPDAYKLNLPSEVCGTHEHSWPDNRAYVSKNGFGSLPYRRPIPAQIRKLPQALADLTSKLGIELTYEQRLFDIPAEPGLPF